MSESPTRQRWLAILGVGEEGVEGLSARARTVLSRADWVIGGERHLALLGAWIPCQRTPWPSPLRDAATDPNATVSLT